MAIIEVENLVKEFKVQKKKKGIKGSLSSLIKPERVVVRAVDNMNFSIKKGEIVGYIGPNGAGKSTTIKMMTGILYPTAGTIRIDGISPHKDRKQVVRNIGVVFGQRTQLYWDLRVGETFELLKRIYNIDNDLYEENINIMNDVLDINSIMDTPVRQLSLGQRMRGDLAAAMLHSPSILFLDEPTIGLDIQGKSAIRKFIAEINRIKGTTVILTTHDLDDVEYLCKRLMIINKGKLVEDGALQTIIDKISPHRYLIVDLTKETRELKHPLAKTVKQEGLRFWMKFNRSETSATKVISELLKNYSIKDFSIKEPEIEEVIREIYKR